MSEVAFDREPLPEPDVSDWVTEDDTPVDNWYSERQQKLLGEALASSYDPGTPYLAVTDIGFFYGPGSKDVLVPDFMLSLDVTFPEDYWKKSKRSYFIWKFGKPPDLALEIVSNDDGGELTGKLKTYQRTRVPYYVVYDPEHRLGKRDLRLYRLEGLSYVEVVDPLVPLEDLGLRLCFWEGTYQQMTARWLRWCFPDGTLLLTGDERASQEAERAEREAERAEREAERAEREAERAEREAERAEREAERARRLEQRLRELGVKPD